MRPLQCTAGFGMPVHAGRGKIVAIAVNVQTAEDPFECALWDTSSNAVVDENNPPQDGRRLFNITGDGNGPNFFSFQEPLDFHRGVSVGDALNLEGGQLYVYVR